MSFQTILSNPQTRIKDTYASSSNVGLTLRANGEEDVSVIDRNGNIFPAEIPTPTAAPTVVDTGTGTGHMTANKWVGYVYVYAADAAYPFVENDNAINGSLAPRSNPSPSVTKQVGATPHPFTITVTKTTRADINKIWIFRTGYFDTSLEASTAADAGQAFFIGEVTNDGVAGTTTYTDNAADTGIDQPDLDNFPAPQFQFCLYDDPYWWGFGNFPFTADVAWFTDGTVQLLNSTLDKWFDGRNGQFATLSSIKTGGFDGQGGFLFYNIDGKFGQLKTDANTNATLAANGAGQIIIQGPATTLFRSKRRNPFSWGRTLVVGDVDVPELWTLKVDGGYGTAIAVVPSVGLLKLDTEYPSRCHVLNLRTAGLEQYTGQFAQTLRTISDIYSVSSHWSQFSAMTQQGQAVLWGIDYKNFAILQSNGVTQVPIATAIPKTLRMLSQIKHRQLMAHGVYDPKTELNCLWVTTANSQSLVDYLIFEHVPTGFWGFVDEKDITCSALIQDPAGNINKVFVGTQTGFLGQAFADNIFSNWLPSSGLYKGTVSAGGFASLQTTDGTFNTTDDGLVGNWCLVTDSKGQTEQWGRISAVTANELTFDLIKPAIGNDVTQFNPSPSAGCKFYIGVIECNLIKAYDFAQPDFDKLIEQFWITQQNSDNETLIRYFRDRRSTYEDQFAVLQTKYLDQSLSDAHKVDLAVPSLQSKAFAIQVINRGYADWRFINMLFEADSNE